MAPAATAAVLGSRSPRVPAAPVVLVTDQRWEQLVQRLDALAARKPGAYRMRVGLLAGLGFGYLAFTLVLLLALIGGIALLAIATAGAVIKFAWPLLIILFVVLRALWFR